MRGEYLVCETDSLCADCKNELLRSAKKAFLQRNFELAAVALEELADTVGGECLESINTNLALMYHLLGDYEAADKRYGKAGKTIIREINYYAFCHRYFNYSRIEEKYIPQDVPLESLLRHNRLNFISYSQNRMSLQLQENYCDGIFGEQLQNDGNIKCGKPVNTTYNSLMKKSYLQAIGTEKYLCAHTKNEKTRIGIFVTDIQRHKDSAIIFELVDILLDFTDVYIYFDNIFFNKLIRLLETKAVTRNTSNLSFSRINNLMVQDNIDGIIDLAEIGLRNNNMALTFWNERLINMSELLLGTPLILESKTYFSEYAYVPRGDKIAVIGDLRYITDDELVFIKKKYIDCGDIVIFQSPMFEDSISPNQFKNRMCDLGIPANEYEIEKGVLPFTSYMEFLSSVKIAVVPNGASHVEVSELIHCGTPMELLSNNTVIRGIAECFAGMPGTYTAEHDCRAISLMREKFIENLKNKIEGFSGELTLLEDKDYTIAYQEGNTRYCINCTCNGDIVVYDDIIGDRIEYTLG